MFGASSGFTNTGANHDQNSFLFRNARTFVFNAKAVPSLSANQTLVVRLARTAAGAGLGNTPTEILQSLNLNTQGTSQPIQIDAGDRVVFRIVKAVDNLAAPNPARIHIDWTCQ